MQGTMRIYYDEFMPIWTLGIQVNPPLRSHVKITSQTLTRHAAKLIAKRTNCNTPNSSNYTGVLTGPVFYLALMFSLAAGITKTINAPEKPLNN